MRKLPLLLGLTVGSVSVATIAQVGVAYPQGNDASANATSDSRSRASGPNAADEYLHRQQMQDLATKESVSFDAARPAKPNELSAGAKVNDKSGVQIATIDKIETDGIILSDGGAKVKVPVDAFGHNKAGLLLDMTKLQFDKIVNQANLSH